MGKLCDGTDARKNVVRFCEGSLCEVANRVIPAVEHFGFGALGIPDDWLWRFYYGDCGLAVFLLHAVSAVEGYLLDAETYAAPGENVFLKTPATAVDGSLSGCARHADVDMPEIGAVYRGATASYGDW